MGVLSDDTSLMASKSVHQSNTRPQPAAKQGKGRPKMT